MTAKPINVIFDGDPGAVSCRFIDVEDDDGRSLRAGEWIERTDGTWALRITRLPDALDNMFAVAATLRPHVLHGSADAIRCANGIALDLVENVFNLKGDDRTNFLRSAGAVQ